MNGILKLIYRNDSVKSEIERVKAELKKLKAVKKQKLAAKADEPVCPVVQEPLKGAKDVRNLSALEQERQKYFTTKKNDLIFGKKKPANQAATLEALEKFKSILNTYEDANVIPLKQKSLLKPSEFPQRPSHDTVTDGTVPCALHNIVGCGSCKDMFTIYTGLDDEPKDDSAWLSHRLAFVKQPGQRDVRQDLDELVVIDPRARMESFGSK